MKLQFLVILLPFILTACKEKDAPDDIIDTNVTIEAGSYKSSDNLYALEPVMYVNNSGVITDQKIVTDFLKRRNMYDQFTFQSPEINKNPVTINISSKFSFNTSYSVENNPVTITSNLGIQKGLIYGVRGLESPIGLDGFIPDSKTGLLDSSATIQIKRMDGDSVPFFFPSSRDFFWQTLEIYRGLPFYVTSCPAVFGTHPDTTDILNCYKIPQFPLLYTNKKLKLPLYTSVLYSVKSNMIYKVKDEWNYFFANKVPLFSIWLGVGDTLVVQNKTLYLNKN